MKKFGHGRPKVLKNSCRITADIEGHQRSKLERIAAKKGMTLAEVIRMIIERYKE